MKKLKQEKAITLVAMVITIILLLILAGISIQAITNTGLFEAAGQAKKEAKRAQVVEWLNLKLIEEQTYNPIGTSEQIIKATKLRVDNNKSELEKIGKTVIVEETKTEEEGEQVDIYFYVQVDKDVFKVEIKGSQFIGEAGKFPPIIKLESVTSTTNSITVTVSTKRNEGGNIEYYIKSEDEEKYTLKETTEDESYQYTGLEQNKNYSIKIVAIAENKQTAEVTKDVLLGSVTNLTDANIIFTYEPDSWTNGSVKVTAALKDMTSSYTLKITDSNPVGASKATALGWADASTGITVDSNKTIYALLIDNEGQIGAAATGNVDKIDTQKPVASVSGTTTNSITFTGSDTAKTGESASGIAAYIVQESSTAPAANSTSWTSYNGTSKTVSGLTQGRTYHVFVKDNAGNVSAAASEGTGTVTSGLTTGAITFSTATWNDGRATITISTNTDYAIQYQKNSVTGEWTTGTSATNLTHNDIVYARLIDTTGQSGNTGTDTSNYASTNIVDGVKPTIGSSVGSTATGNTGTVSVSNIADTGGSGLKGIYISQNTTTPTATSVTWTPNTNNQYSTSVSSNGTYNVWVIDNAGNVSNVSTCTVSGIVSKISISSYSDASVTAPNTVTPTLSYSGTPKTITYSSSDVTVATVNSSGVVTGKKVGKTTITATAINYDGTSVTETCIVRVSEYLLYWGDKKTARTGGWSFARGETGTTETYDTNDSNGGGLEFTLNDSGAYASWSTNNKINVDEIGRMKFLISHWTNHSDLIGKISLSFSYDKSAGENLYWWNAFTFNSEAVTEEKDFWCGDTTGDYYIKIYGLHSEFQGYTVGVGLHYVLAEPKLY